MFDFWPGHDRSVEQTLVRNIETIGIYRFQNTDIRQFQPVDYTYRTRLILRRFRT